MCPNDLEFLDCENEKYQMKRREFRTYKGKGREEEKQQSTKDARFEMTS